MPTHQTFVRIYHKSIHMPSNELEEQHAHECCSSESHTDSYSCENLISSPGSLDPQGSFVLPGLCHNERGILIADFKYTNDIFISQS